MNIVLRKLGIATALAALAFSPLILAASPLDQLPRMALAVRNNQQGQFESMSGIPVYLGTIDATTTSKTNHEATTAFNNTGRALCGKVLLIQNAGSVDIRLHPVSTNTGTVSNSRGTGFGPAIAAGERVIVYMASTGRCWVAGITTSSTANIDFWELQ